MHEYGCDNEECPACKQMLIGCTCNCLSPVDAARIITQLHNQFATLSDAVSVVLGFGSASAPNTSYLVHAAMQYLYNNMTIEIQEDLARNFQKSHPLLVPQLRDASGHGYYTAEQLSLALGIPLSEVYEQIDAMIEAGQAIRFGDGIKLQKIN